MFILLTILFNIDLRKFSKLLNIGKLDATVSMILISSFSLVILGSFAIHQFQEAGDLVSIISYYVKH